MHQFTNAFLYIIYWSRAQTRDCDELASQETCGDGVNDALLLKKAEIGIVVADATDAARTASDIVLTEPGLSVIISAVLTSRAIFQRMKNYTVSFWFLVLLMLSYD